MSIRKLIEEDEKISNRMDELQRLNQYSSEEYRNLKIKQQENDKKMNEYLDMVKDQNIDKDIRTCLGMLSKMDEFTIGSHMCGLNNRIMCEPHELANSILTKGLISARNEGGGILEDVHILGDTHIIDNLRDMLENFYYRALILNKGGIVVAIPTTMINEDNERIPIGTFPNDLDFNSKYDSRVSELPINDFVTKIGYLPPEFIMGVVSKDKDDNVSFTKNDRFISNLSIEEQKELYNRFIDMGLQVNNRIK